MGQRELIREFVLRDIRLKYRGSAFGYLWSLLEPMLMAMVFVVMFSLISRGAGRGYTLSIVIGVIVWQYFSIAMARCQGSLSQNAGLIEQIYVPREVFGIAGVVAQFIMAALSLVVVVPFMIYYGLPPTVELLYVPLGMVLITMLATGVGMGSAPWNVLNRDVEYFTGFLTRAGMYISPVMWSLSTIPPGQATLKKIMLLNPLTVPMEMVKQGVLGAPIGASFGYIAYSCAFCVGSLWLGLSVFRRMEGIVVKKL
ncbi:MAG: ABC transporter permease [Proteobacteria bacterium]|nr:ABC transporter permease [Pseudomonadota bacterium]